LSNIDLVAGVDISAAKHDADVACAALIIYSCKMKTVLHEETEMFNVSHQPYVPGFLAFREVPVLMELFKRLKHKQPQLWPELVLLDGNGILHNNQCGLACHLGVLVDLPTIGVGKTLFYIDGLGKEKVKAQCEQEIKEAGDFSLLVGDSGKAWGAAVRNTKAAINPIFVSIGHKIELDTAVKCVLKLSEFRVVEPIRLADKKSRELVEAWKGDKAILPSYEMVYLQK
jgi:endonuclease V